MTTKNAPTDAEIIAVANEIYGSVATMQELQFARAILSRFIQPAMPADAWQPIETAPKDGTVIDLWHSEFGRYPDCHWGLPEHCCGEMGSLCDSDWHGLEPSWVDEFNEISWVADGFTHWMPLSDGPDARRRIEGES